jgi:hypothetical protein
MTPFKTNTSSGLKKYTITREGGKQRYFGTGKA